MTNVFAVFEHRIREIVHTLDFAKGMDLELSRVNVEPPRDPAHGNLATNAAMVLAKPAKQNPREIAQQLVAALMNEPEIASAEIAGPGFINMRLHDSYWNDHLTSIVTEGGAYGGGETGNGLKVNVEYVSANPTGPMHVGHCRGAVVGDALANLLAFAGYDVTREYYTNDAGGQIEVLAKSAYLRYLEALGDDVGAIPEGLYPGEYLIPLGKSLADVHGEALRNADESEWLPIVKNAAIEAMMDLIREDLAALGVEHDVFFSEQSLHALQGNISAIETAINRLTDMGWSIRAHCHRPREWHQKTGRIANNCFSDLPMSATTWIGHWSNRTVNTLTSPQMWGIFRTSSIAVSEK